MLSDSEIALMAHAYAIRNDEQEGADQWFAPTDDTFTEAARLWTRGYLDRRWHADDLVYRLSDKMLSSMLMLAMMRSARASQN